MVFVSVPLFSKENFRMEKKIALTTILRIIVTNRPRPGNDHFLKFSSIYNELERTRN